MVCKKCPHSLGRVVYWFCRPSTLSATLRPLRGYGVDLITVLSVCYQPLRYDEAITLDNVDNMASNPFFSGRIPQSLYDAIEGHREKSGESKTDVLIRALSAYVNLPIETSSAEAAVNDTRLESLERRMAQMEQILLSLQPATQALAETVQGQMSIDDISINDNISDNISDNKVLMSSTSVIEADKKFDNTEEDEKFDNISDNKYSSDVITNEQSELWTTNQIKARLGISRAKLDYWDKVGKLPHTEKGYTIKRLAGKEKQKSNRREKVWEVCGPASS